MARDNAGPFSGVPDGLGAKQNPCVVGRAGVDGFETGFGGKIADALVCLLGVALEFGGDRGQIVQRANRSANPDAYTFGGNKAYYSVFIRGEPPADAGIKDLVGGRVPTVSQDDAAGFGDGWTVF